ncbi:MFS transporter [Arthrobacter sp. STN4]|uniref:MFS transporter n=1 Tax=Arthrobacter sp. STN4 TaxID=2923276 RepID=UPI00211A59B7|nr:MFS transporter [Arthrobacter sp. STN4]MCQ9164522.1 MHS family MFS transporter [Arthrobacter sp. STN4]
MPNTSDAGGAALPGPILKMRKIAVASVIGTTVEWYDLFLFATASALVFNKIFFPSFDPLVGTMLAFGTFAAAYVARIIGAALFGHFGDRMGRKSMLLTSLLTMGAATFAIGLLPDYGTIGVAAPILLLTLRIIQGLALGGEWGGAVLMVVEHSPKAKRGFYGSLVQVGVPGGTLIANLVFLLVAGIMPEQALLSWGWRIPFLVSVLLVAIGLYIRLSLEETPSFQAVKDAGAKAKIPLFDLLRKYWKQVILGALATVSTGTAFNVLVAFGLTYGKTELKFSTDTMLLAVLSACVVGLVMLPVFGKMSDKFGRKPVIIGGLVAEIVLSFPMFWLMDTRTVAGLILGYVLMMTAFCANYGPIATFLAELFGPRVRYSGLSVAYMLAGLLGSAITPVVTTALLNATGQGSSVAWFLIGSAVVSLVALLLLTETLRSNIDAVDHQSSRLNAGTPVDGSGVTV